MKVVKVNPAYESAPIQLCWMTRTGGFVSPSDLPFRWLNEEDAKHDWDRMNNGLPAERTVPPFVVEEVAA